MNNNSGMNNLNIQNENENRFSKPTPNHEVSRPNKK